MTLALSYPDDPVMHVARDLRVALASSSDPVPEWDFDWSEKDLGYRIGVESVQLGVNREFGRARLVVNPAGESVAGDEIMPELEMSDIPELVDPAQRIVIYAERMNSATGDGAASRSFLFDGFMPAPHLQFTETEERPEILATSLLERVDAQRDAIVNGRMMAFAQGGNDVVRCVPSSPCAFNFKGKPNRHPELQAVTVGTQDYENVPAFTWDGNPEAKYWRLADVLAYLLVFHFNPAAEQVGIADANGAARVEAEVILNREPQLLSDPNNVTWQQVIATKCPELAVRGPVVAKGLLPWCKAAGARMMQVTLNNGGQPATKLVFWLRGEGGAFAACGGPTSEREIETAAEHTQVEPRSMMLPKTGARQKDVDKAEAQRGEVVFDAGQVVTRAVVRGDPVVYEVTVGRGCAVTPADVFRPAWAPDAMFGDGLSGEALEDKVADIKLATTNDAEGDAATMYNRYDRRGPDHYKYSHVGRRWALNEAGEYNGATYGRANGGTTIWNSASYGTPYDFHELCGIDKPVDPETEEEVPWSVRRRAVMSLISEPDEGKGQLPRLECSWDGGAHWYPYPGNYSFVGCDEPHAAQIGVFLADFNLAEITNKSPADGDETQDQSVWEAIVRGAFRLALTCSIQSDERVEGESDAAAGWGGYQRRVEMDAAKGELRCEVLANSRLKNEPGWSCDERDDSEKARALANAYVQTYQTRLISGTVIIPFACNDWLPGDLCSGIEPRGVSFRTTKGKGGRRPEVIQTLIHNSAGDQSTHVMLDDLRTQKRGV